MITNLHHPQHPEAISPAPANPATTSTSGSAASSSGGARVSSARTPFGDLFVQNLDTHPVVAEPAHASPVATPATNSSAPTAVATTSDDLLAATAALTSTKAAAATAATQSNAPAATAVTVQSQPPTAQSVFGSNPWIANAGGNGPTGPFNLNPMYFATPQTAAEVAAMVGGTVVPVNTFAQTPGNPFTQNVPNEMVELANGKMINPGLVAGFYTHGYPQSMVNQMIQNEVQDVSEGI